MHKFDSIFNHSVHLIGLLDVEGRVLLANKTSLDLINAKNEDIYLEYFWDTPWWKDKKEDQEKLRQGIKSAISNKETTFQSTHFNEIENKLHHVEFSMKPYFNKNGKIIFLIVESADVTNIKDAKNEILKLKEELEIKVENRTKELENSNTELQNTLLELKETQDYLIHVEKMASLGDLVAGVAHEINTPVGMSLTGITHFIDISENLQKSYKNEDMSQAEFETYLENSTKLAKSINVSLVKAASLIKSFKEIAVDQSSEAIRLFNMKNYIDEVLLSLHHELKRRKHIIQVECASDLEIKSHPGAFSQIITNLIMNSFIHAFKNDAVGNITIELQVDNNILFLTYTDDGKGIMQENLTKIFDPFFTTNRKYGGSGLGLNIIFNIVNTTLKGKIECSSIEDVGVEFKIVIPLEK